jgi:hypothetical protein
VRISVWALEVLTGKETCLGVVRATPLASMELVRLHTHKHTHAPTHRHDT